MRMTQLFTRQQFRLLTAVACMFCLGVFAGSAQATMVITSYGGEVNMVNHVTAYMNTNEPANLEIECDAFGPDISFGACSGYANWATTLTVGNSWPGHVICNATFFWYASTGGDTNDVDYHSGGFGTPCT